MRHIFNALLVLALVAGKSALAEQTTGGAGRSPSPSFPAVVVELFTSQGCSSCPPADALLGELAKRPNVIPLAFHVDYWDGAYWRDRFAISEAARRQERYVERLGLSTAFTPQAIVDGKASYVGSDRRLLAEASPDRRSEITIGLRLQDGDLVATLPDSTSRGTLDVNLVAYRSAASTPVTGGENSGRKLDEFNIVRSISRLGSWEGSAQELTVPLAKLPPDADHAALLIQQPGQGNILAAASIQIRLPQR